jgi:subtilisin family serine protease
VTFHWLSNAPTESQYNRIRVDASRFEITPDLPGEYNLLIIASRGNGKCLGRNFRFGATRSEAFQGAQPARAFDAGTDRVRFKHLEVLEAEAAWQVTQGQGAIVAVIDTGVNFNHPDLSQNIAVNGSGQVVGRDFWKPTRAPSDDNGHGTHVAGLSSSAVSGLAPESKIVPIKALNAMGGGDLAALVAAIRFAGTIGVDVINASFGGENERMSILGQAITEATARGALFVAAAGNGDSNGNGFDVGARPFYPVILRLDGQLTVAATRLDGGLSKFSNFGVNHIDVAAPGGDPSPDQGGLQAAYYLPEHKLYVAQMGTSMATPVVSGVAALVKASHPSWKGREIKARLLEAGNELPALQGKVRSGRLLNARVAAARLR